MKAESTKISDEKLTDEKQQLLIDKSSKPLPKIDEILNNSGYNYITWKIIFLTGFYIFVEGSQLTLMNSLFVPLKNYLTTVLPTLIV